MTMVTASPNGHDGKRYDRSIENGLTDVLRAKGVGCIPRLPEVTSVLVGASKGRQIERDVAAQELGRIDAVPAGKG